MAFVVESTATKTFTAGTTAVITKPTGLAVGDLLVAQLGAVSTGAAITYTTLAGWSLAANGGGSDYTTSIQYKIADSGDVAASNFTFTCTSASHTCGSLLRVSGPRPTSVLAEAEGDTLASGGTTAISFSAALTPFVANSLVVTALMGAATDGTGTISGFTSTPSITFTEVLDTSVDNSTRDPIFGSAYGLYTGTADITAYGATLSGSKDQHYGVIASFTPLVNASGSNALLSADADVFVPAASSGTLGTNALLSADADLFTPTAKGTSPTQWSPASKPSTTWTPTSK